MFRKRIRQGNRTLREGESKVRVDFEGKTPCRRDWGRSQVGGSGGIHGGHGAQEDVVPLRGD